MSGVATVAEKIGCKTIASRDRRSRCAGATAGTQDPKIATTMTDNILKSLVTEAVSFDREINEKTYRLKELKAELVAEARSRESELVSTDSGGRRWTAEGSDSASRASPFLHRLSRRRSTSKPMSSKRSRISQVVLSLASSSLLSVISQSRHFAKKQSRGSRRRQQTT
jgi:hypothetical protein